MAEFKIPSPTEFAAASAKGKARARQEFRAISARYDEASGCVTIALNNGAMVGFPLAMLPGLASATNDDLTTIEVQEDGYGLHVPALDADIAIPRLMEDHLGASAMRVRQQRAAASRANGRLGGRPRKQANR